MTPIMDINRDTRHLAGWFTQEVVITGVVKRRKTNLPNTYHTMQIRKLILVSYWFKRSTTNPSSD